MPTATLSLHDLHNHLPSTHIIVSDFENNYIFTGLTANSNWKTEREWPTKPILKQSYEFSRGWPQREEGKRKNERA